MQGAYGAHSDWGQFAWLPARRLVSNLSNLEASAKMKQFFSNGKFGDLNRGEALDGRTGQMPTYTGSAKPSAASASFL